MLKANPALRPRRLKTEGSYRPWTVEQIRPLVEAVPALRLPVMLALATDQRGGDLARMEWRNYDGTAIEVVLVWIPCHPELRAQLDATSRTGQTILTRPDGQPWGVGQFQTMVSKAIRGGGLVWHGLRHTTASWLAESGCSEREIMATTGHKASAMVGRYVARADQHLRATSAAAKLAGRRIERPDDTE